MLKTVLAATTPKAISPEIMRFCETIIPGSTPIFMEVQPEPGSVMNECFDNVSTFVKRRGGTPLLGRTIWNYHDLWLEAEFHSVWKTPDGELTDITPPVDGESVLMFLPDPAGTFDYDNPRVPGNRRMALVDNTEVAQYIRWANRFDIIRTSYRYPQMPASVLDFSDALALRTEYLKRAFQNHGIPLTEPPFGIDTVLEFLKLHRPAAIQSDCPCPCGSHKPYGRCCRPDDMAYKRDREEWQITAISTPVAAPKPVPDPAKALASGRCPCGSRKMFKKCHGATTSRTCGFSRVSSGTVPAGFVL